LGVADSWICDVDTTTQWHLPGTKLKSIVSAEPIEWPAQLDDKQEKADMLANNAAPNSIATT
jgi:hypothetical protein